MGTTIYYKIKCYDINVILIPVKSEYRIILQPKT